MERKFKHKKTGEIAYYKDGVFKQGRFCIEIGVEPSSEFWQEIVEKDFGILSFSLNDKEFLFSEDDGMYWSKQGTWANFVESLNDKIISVKNLKNNLVLTIGDTAQTIGSYPHKIQSFEIRQKCKGRVNGEWIKDGIDRIWINWTNASGGTWLEDAEKVEDKPLFTTLDNVELKYGDKFYVVDTKFLKIFEAEAGVTFKTEKWIKNSYHSKGLAEAWIELNKPKYSIKDMVDAVNNWSMSRIDVYDILKFYKVAESKIKGDE